MAAAETLAGGDRKMRPAQPADAEILRRCARAAYEIYVPRMDREPAPMLADYEGLVAAGNLFVLEHDGKIAGFIVLFPKNGDLFIENLAIWPDLQGRRLGRFLMAFAEEEARRLGLGRLRLYTNEVMTENFPFYRRLGFSEEGLVVEDGYRRMYFSKMLKA